MHANAGTIAQRATPDGGERQRSRGKCKIFMKSLQNLTMNARGEELPKRNNSDNGKLSKKSGRIEKKI
jgi:hypothetical protein